MDSPGQNGWIGEAVARHERLLIGYAARLLGGNDLDAARDVVQDAFVRLCAQDRATVEPHLAEWLLAVVRHRAIDVRRKAGRMRLVEPRDSELIPATESNPSAIVETNSDATIVLAMLDALPGNQAEVIRLKFQHGLSYQQIANVTKLSVSNVGYLIHTGLKTLRTKLNVSSNDERAVR
jgi:RNA polymerase sigma-70 factor (ECF subfamily)